MFFNTLSVSLLAAASTLAAATPVKRQSGICIEDLKYTGYYGDSITQVDQSCAVLVSLLCLLPFYTLSAQYYSFALCFLK